MARPGRTVLEYRHYDLPADFPLLVLTGDKWHISPVPGKHLHIHNCLEIGICHTSGGTMVFDRQKVEFHAGDITCIARNVPHTTWSAKEPSLWSYIFLDPELLLDDSSLHNHAGLSGTSRFLHDCRLLLQPGPNPWAVPLVTAIIREATAREPGWHSCVRGLCAALLIQILRVYSREGADTVRDPYIHAVSPALDYIQANYMLSFPQDELARVCHLSPTHFRRLFREETGTSPLSFLHQTRILRSCVLLRTTEQSVIKIAEAVGYNSLSSFNRHFAQFMNSTPTHWRKTDKENLRPSLLTYSGWTEAEDIKE